MLRQLMILSLNYFQLIYYMLVIFDILQTTNPKSLSVGQQLLMIRALQSISRVFPFSTVSEATIQLDKAQYFRLPEDSIPVTTQVTRLELLQHYKQLNIMRNMEITCDILYKAKKIQGFCHLYDGQEAIPEGMEAALTFQDPLIGAYRIHCQAYKRGISVRQIIGEMLGKRNGATQGRGGSMHFYKKEINFYGGNGIVGAQVPVGAGLAFALKYNQNKQNVASVMFGDGAANQGQLFEAANMAKIWNLPALFICENNNYGMGTSVVRSSMNIEFYKRGDVIPGFRIDGNNVFEVRQAFKWAKKWAIQNGPLFIELICYRYHGHSMSDPGVTYRKRDEVQGYRKTKDPILILRQIAEKNNLATAEQLEQIENEAETWVKSEAKLAEEDPQVDPSELTNHVYVDNQKHFIRGKLYEESIRPQGQKY